MDDMIETFVTPEDAEILNQAKAHGIKTPEDFEDLSGLSFFVSIPSQLLIRKDISSEAKIIYAMIIGLTRLKGVCNPSNEYLSKISGIKLRSVPKHLAKLHKTGLINLVIERNSSGTWRYLSPLTAESLYAHFPGLYGGDTKNGRRGIQKSVGLNNKEDNNRITPIVPLQGDDSISASASTNSNNNGNSASRLEAELESFEAVWATYPRRLGKKAALRHWKASIETDQDIEDIKYALTAYKAHIVRERIEPRFIQQGSTWFNNWKDWLETKTETSPQVEESKESKIARGHCIKCKGGKIEETEEYGKMCNQCNERYNPVVA